MPPVRGIFYKDICDKQMRRKKYISASEIGDYTFCPRAWALKKLDYESDNKYELEAGKKYHIEVGKMELVREIEEKPRQIRLKRQSRFLSVLIILIIFCIMSIIIRIVLK